MSYYHLLFDAAVVLAAGAINVRLFILLWDLRSQTRRFLLMTQGKFSPDWPQGRAWEQLAQTVKLDYKNSLSVKRDVWRKP